MPIRVTAQGGAADTLLSKTDMAMAAGTVEILAADANKRPFIAIGSFVDGGGLTNIELKMGPSGSERSMSDVIAGGGSYATTLVLIGNVNERIIVVATGASTGKYRVTCGYIGSGIGGTSS